MSETSDLKVYTDPQSKSGPLSEIGAMIRAIHHYGYPPDVRLQEDVDADVEDILASIRDYVKSVKECETEK